MIIWGSGGDNVDLGEVDTRHCETCGQDRPFHVMLHYEYWGLYYIFNLVSSKEYMLVCEVCQRGWQLDGKEIESMVESNPIPFMRRFGCLILVVLFVLLLATASASS